MRLSDFDPWQARRREPEHAYRAYPAYLDNPLGTIGRIGSMSGPRIVEQRTVEVSPSTSPLDKMSDALERWRSALRQNKASDANIERVRRRAVAFCDTSWPVTLLLLGWSEQELFSFYASDRSGGGLVQNLDRRRVIIASGTRAVLLDMNERAVHFERRQVVTSDALLIWNL
jgi:hypothetical protein